MVDYLKIFEKCRDTLCGNVFTKEELDAAKEEYKNAHNKECKKEKDVTKQIRCTFKVLSKSKYQKLLKKRTKCAKKKCKKEHEDFRKSFSKSFKKNRKSMKKKK